jgi:hypothetical protein
VGLDDVVGEVVGLRVSVVGEALSVGDPVGDTVDDGDTERVGLDDVVGEVVGLRVSVVGEALSVGDPVGDTVEGAAVGTTVGGAVAHKTKLSSASQVCGR